MTRKKDSQERGIDWTPTFAEAESESESLQLRVFFPTYFETYLSLEDDALDRWCYYEVPVVSCSATLGGGTVLLGRALLISSLVHGRVFLKSGVAA